MLLPARDVVNLLVRRIRPALEGAGDIDWGDASLERLWTDGIGADRQRRATALGRAYPH
ncbi:hypothetical protein [Crystallibacter degradans]|uniref:hypothetical protein n=1 Tax=Crystallibacter degradans TaxID=2726743 RepID=UPI001474D37A|nr:hypothetical protein [Arthrobacter sp. SF27]NMR31189.1 hypothetical protein [Arthrobacter sp. SF27]